MKYLDATNAGAEIDLDAADPKTKWLVAEGYLVKPGEKDEERGIYQTSEPAKGDPTLAENREKPGAPKEHLSNLGDEGDSGETTHGKNMGLDAEPVGAPGPKVKITAHKDAGASA